MKLKHIWLITTCLIASLSLNAQTYNPIANKEAIVINKNARFTLLTNGLIRMEWSEKGRFEDNSSLVFVNRNLPVPEYKTYTINNWLHISTQNYVLKYKLNSGKFTNNNLKVNFRHNNQDVVWTIDLENSGNLLGTTKTLDGTDGDMRVRKNKKVTLENGILSTEGWTLIDDSNRPLFDNTDWSWVIERDSTGIQDFYLFIYGSDYKQALYDFTQVAGKIPMPPKYAFGYWWSRWYMYSERHLKELISEFEFYNVPLDVLVIDMDWHYTNLPEFFENGKRILDKSGEIRGTGWTGYTWNKNMFPDYKKFLDYTNKKELKTCLNLHPAGGIQPHEVQYKAMAKAVGIDPASKEFVPFNITDKNYAKNFTELVLRPHEKAGIDFWWLDWQQWGHTNIRGVNPIFYLNYVFFTDMKRNSGTRPLIYHRWGGLGNHRYQMGFSGDTKISWNTLDYQPYFTSTASNVGFGYWGHDIGGFAASTNIDPQDPELYARWFQFGVFSPILKTHAAFTPNIKRKIWEYPPETFKRIHKLISLRYDLIPYIYKYAREAYETGISLMRPMYYSHPADSNAYAFKNQYMFGDELLVAPITSPIDKEKLFIKKQIWLPQGNWYEWFTGEVIEGGNIIERVYTIDEMPVFVKENSIIPMQPGMKNTSIKSQEPLQLHVYHGAGGKFELYSDEGTNADYDVNYNKTPISFSRGNNDINLKIHANEGSNHYNEATQAYEIVIHNTIPPKNVTINGVTVNYVENGSSDGWFYDGNNLSLHVIAHELQLNKESVIDIEFSNYDYSKLNGVKRKMQYVYNFSKYWTTTYNYFYTKNWNPSKYEVDLIFRLAQAGDRITSNPTSFKQEISTFRKEWKSLLSMLHENSADVAIYDNYIELFDAID